MARVRDWEWPEICCNTCKKLRNIVPDGMKVGERMKYLYYFCPVIDRKVELEEIVDPELMPCNGEHHEKIERQCVSMVRWKASPHLLSSGIRMRCRHKALPGTTICGVHGATPPKRLKEGTRLPAGNRPKNKMVYFKDEVSELIRSFYNDRDLENVEFELAYLKSLLIRIENSEFKDEEARIKLLKSTLESIFKVIETRENIIEKRRYSLGLEKVRLLMQAVFEIVKLHVNDIETIKKIGNDMKKVAVSIQNIDDEAAQTRSLDDLDELKEKYKAIEAKTVKSEIKPKKKKKVKK